MTETGKDRQKQKQKQRQEVPGQAAAPPAQGLAAAPKDFLAISALLLFPIIVFAFLLRNLGDFYTQPIFLHFFLRHDAPAALLAILILAAAGWGAGKIPPAIPARLLTFCRTRPAWLAAMVVLLCSLGTVFLCHDLPLSWDEYSLCTQARIFAAGKLWGQFPPQLSRWLFQPQSFAVFSFENGRHLSSYWPGFALLLSPFMKLGAPWLLNPLLGAATVLLIHFYAGRIFTDADAPAWAVLLTMASPVLWANSISYYAMPAHLFMNLLYAALLLNPTPRRLLAAGGVGSLALVLHNPVPHTLFAIPWLVWLARGPGRSKRLGCLLLGYAPLSLLLGYGWTFLQETIQAGTTAPAESLARESQNLVTLLVAKPWHIIRSVSSLPDAQLLWFRLAGTLKLFVWAVPGLPVLAFYGWRTPGGHVHLRLWSWSAALTFTGYFFVHADQGAGWGYRYFHGVWPVLPLLATAFLAGSRPPSATWKPLVVTVAAASLVLSTPLRFGQIGQYIDQHLAQLPPIKKDMPQICFIDYGNDKRVYGTYYTHDFIQNDPFLRR
ncbi:MAG: hypothetical protein OEV91_10350, partial [Desulfobulbaceae bacterium]|nr:hypothetical protein [Desulfobulbaceae bacterium]